MAVPQIGYCESFAIIDFGESHCEFGDGAFLLLLVGEIESGRVRAYFGNGTGRERKEIEEETERDAECEAIPNLCDWIGGLTKVTVWRGEDEEMRKVWDAHETSTQRRALLVE